MPWKISVKHAVTVAAGVFAPGHLGELTQCLPFELVDDILEQTKTVQRRLRDLPSRAGVYFLLALGMSPRLGYARVWAKLTAGLAGMDLPCPSEKALRDLRCRRRTGRRGGAGGGPAGGDPRRQPDLARAIIAEIGLDMSRFPTAAHLVSWAGLCPSARQSGPRTRAGKKGQGDTWLRGALGQAANGAARTATFLGERYHRIARRRGKVKAQVAVARSILVMIWHLQSDRAARFTELGHDYYQARLDTDRKLRNHIRQIQALGFAVTITKAA